MIEVLRSRVTGPLEPYAAGFAVELARLGYTANSAAAQVSVVAHLSRWMVGEHLDAVGLVEPVVERYMAARRAAGYTNYRTARALCPLLTFLRGVGVEPPRTVAALTPVDVLLERYRHYLIVERGLSVRTVRGYLDAVRPFVTGRAGVDGLDLADLTAGDVTAFVLAACSGLAIGSAKMLVTALRSLLRFLHVDGVIPAGLAGAVPSVAGWRLAGLPRALEPDQVAALLESCDRGRTVGRRDAAILLLLVRLGLRAGEVAALGLDDVAWRAGEIIVRGKGNHAERLPLPAEVGDAVAGYLRRGRPATAEGRTVFVRVKAPHRGLSTGAVTEVVFAAGQRAGLGKIYAHRLRHTAATAMLRAGTPLAEVGQVLRHRRALTTAIYAKVDRDALGTLAGNAVMTTPVTSTRDQAGLRQALADYLVLRRAMGYRLARPEKLLNQFLDYLDEAGVGTVTVAHALGWARLPAGGERIWWAYRLSAVRGFARYLHTLDPATEVPPADLLPSRACRANPYLYSDDDIAALIGAAASLRTPTRQVTVQTLIGLLVVTGMRVGEVIALDRGDVDLARGLLLIRHAKFGKSRQLVVHPSTVDALRRYLRLRDRLDPAPSTPAVFVSTTGTRLRYCNVHSTWQRLVRHAGLTPRSASCRPRIHDLRHSYAVATMLDAYAVGHDGQATLALLSTYLGHVDPASTYWYLSAAPELLAVAGQRLEAHLATSAGGRP